MCWYLLTPSVADFTACKHFLYPAKSLQKASGSAVFLQVLLLRSKHRLSIVFESAGLIGPFQNHQLASLEVVHSEI